MPAGKNTSKPKQTPIKKAIKPAPVKQNPKDSLRKYLFPGITIVLCLLLYGNTFNSDYTEDDAIYTKENVYVTHGFSDVKYLFTKGSMYGCGRDNGSSYRPLVLLTFMAETSFFGLNPHVFQRFNVLYFILTCLVFFLFVQKVFQKYNPVVPMAATLLFIFHPIHTDAVANFKSRDEIMTLLFGLLSFFLLLRYMGKKKRTDFLLSIASFAFSLLCKETSVSYLLIIPLVLYFFTSSDWKTILRLSLPYVGVILVYLFIREKIFGSVTSNDQISIMNNSLMAAKNTMDMYATNFVMMGKYLSLLFIPHPLSWDYSYPQIPIVSWANPLAIISLLVYVAIAILIIKWFKKKSIYSFSLIFYVATLFLTSNLVLKLACSFGERFLFSPSVGFCMAMPVLLASALKLNPGDKKGNKLTMYYGITGAVLLIYTLILIPRNSDWKNDYTLFKSGIETSPNSGRTHGALASIYMDTAQAVQDQAKKIQYFNLSAQEFKKVTELFSMDPAGYYNLGVCYYGEGYQDSAIQPYKKTLELAPKYTMASNNLGVIYFNKEQYDLALQYFMMSYKVDSNDLNTLVNISVSYQNAKNYPMALHYDSVIRTKYPNYKPILGNLCQIHNTIGMRYITTNELDKAFDEFSLALKCDSNSANVIGNIGVFYEKKGNTEKARIFFEKALSKDPTNQTFARDLQLLNTK